MNILTNNMKPQNSSKERKNDDYEIKCKKCPRLMYVFFVP